MPARRAQNCGCGRGVFGLIDWTTPLRRPAVLKSYDVPGVTSPQPITSPVSPFPISPGCAVGMWAEAVESPDGVSRFHCGNNLMVKYMYTANTDSPLDLPELSVSQQDCVSFICYHASNKLWSRVCNSEGKEGYVPTDYLVNVDDITSLPWLPKPAVVQQETPEYKPYKSAYQPKAAEEKAEAKQNYYCDVCAREFNGPLPYNSHMKSKAHLEEVQLLKDS